MYMLYFVLNTIIQYKVLNKVLVITSNVDSLQPRLLTNQIRLIKEKVRHR